MVDNNLLRWEEHDGEPRYRMLPVIREYALDRLGESGERGPVERRHATYYGELAEASEPTWGPELSKRLDLLDREQDNVRQALEFALESQDVDLSLRLGAALVQFWRVRGRYEEGRRYLERILALPGPAGLAQTRAKALHGAGLLAFHLQDWETALERFEASLEIWRAAGDRRRAAWVLDDLGLMARYQDDYVTARVHTEESLALFRETHDDVGQAAALQELAFAAHHRGDLATAAELGEQSLALARRSRDTWHVAHALRVLGTVARDRGDFASAQRRFEECLTIFRSFSDWPAVVGVQDDLVRVVATGGSSAADGGLDDATIAALAQESTSTVIAAAWHYRRAWIARGQGDHRQALALFQKSMVQFHAARRPTRMVGCLMSLADLAISLDQPERAARLIGAALGVCNATGMHLSASERGELAHIVAAEKTHLGEESIRALMAEGEAMTPEQAIAYALEVTG